MIIVLNNNKWIHLFLALICISLFVHLLLLISRIQYESRPTKISIFDGLGEAENTPNNINVDAEKICSMANCFNFSKCMDTERLKVYIYPNVPDLMQSKIYSNILNVIRQSQFYTNNPDEACLFVPSIDTTDRDRISANYIRNIGSQFTALPKHIWNDGLNHLIFNIYFGTFPNYADNELGFDPGKAMMAWTSSNRQNFRHHFDISFPLFHQEHPLKQTKSMATFQTNFSGHDKYLATFKGKRYVYGIGSETRDLLHHLHNNRSIIIATTCRHNSDWKKFEDERCELDNARYNNWDYDALMASSTFCLIPRGRRLGSFRFIESLRFICIPVILSDDWVLPFEEVIDWAELVIFGSERNALFIADYLSRIPEKSVLKMRHFAQLIYRNHFASIEQIVLTTFEIIFERIKTNLGIESRKNWMCHIDGD